MDSRNIKLAHTLINYSVKLKKGEKILIEGIGNDSLELVNLCIKEAYAVGAIPFVWISSDTSRREILLNATEEQLKIAYEVDIQLMKQIDAYIGIRATDNVAEISDVPSEKLSMYMKHYYSPLHLTERVSKKWVVLRYPNNSMSQLANMSKQAFSEYYYNVCNLDYEKMDKAMDPLKELLEKTDKVHITGVGTDLTFSIKGIPAKKCSGERNIPDGEVYTAPVKDSVNGYITYNTPALREGFTYHNIKFTFENGKIVEATCNDNTRLNEYLDTDEGARYVGEFAIGVNPYITVPMLDTLFDEKIMGSFHFTPGSCYDDVPNGNKSAIHWDLVCIQTPEYGGGKMYFDGVLVREDGRFVIPELMGLNPENLK